MIELQNLLSRPRSPRTRGILRPNLGIHGLKEINRELISLALDSNDMELILGPRKTHIQSVELVHQILEPFLSIFLFKKASGPSNALVYFEQMSSLGLFIKNVFEAPGCLLIHEKNNDREPQSFCLVDRHHFNRIDPCRDVNGPVRPPCLFIRGISEEIAGIVSPFSFKILDNFQNLYEGCLLFPEVVEYSVNAVD